MTKEIELAAEDAASNYSQHACGEQEFAKIAYRKGFLDCAQWMATRNRWVDFEKENPKLNGNYITIDQDGDIFIALFLVSENDFDTVGYVTHWQHLPSPPQSNNTK